jgi:hypothetical protein
MRLTTRVPGSTIAAARGEGFISRSTRILCTLAGTVVVAALVVWYIVGYAISLPPTVPQASAAGVTNITVQTVASYGHQPHPDWVSYLVKNEQGQWVHSTIWKVPAHSLVRITVYQYDGDSGLRNPFLGQPRGIVGGTMTVNGKPYHVLNPDDASHTFTIPDYGVSVPLKGVADDAPNQCAVTPCTMQQAHNTIVFEFRTGKPGLHRWQCFVPCAAGWLYGFGGPMQTVGWMDGFLKVV